MCGQDQAFLFPYLRVCARMLSLFSCVCLFAILWTVAHQAPLSIDSPGKNTGGELPCTSLGDLPNPDIKPVSLMSPTLVEMFLTTVAIWKALP